MEWIPPCCHLYTFCALWAWQGKHVDQSTSLTRRHHTYRRHVGTSLPTWYNIKHVPPFPPRQWDDSDTVKAASALARIREEGLGQMVLDLALESVWTSLRWNSSTNLSNLTILFIYFTFIKLNLFVQQIFLTNLSKSECILNLVELNE